MEYSPLHFFPVNPFRQIHSNVSPTFTQDPPLWQGFVKQTPPKSNHQDFITVVNERSCLEDYFIFPPNTQQIISSNNMQAAWVQAVFRYCLSCAHLIDTMFQVLYLSPAVLPCCLRNILCFQNMTTFASRQGINANFKCRNICINQCYFSKAFQLIKFRGLIEVTNIVQSFWASITPRYWAGAEFTKLSKCILNIVS